MANNDAVVRIVQHI